MNAIALLALKGGNYSVCPLRFDTGPNVFLMSKFVN
jgi:hypothetical protein